MIAQRLKFGLGALATLICASCASPPDNIGNACDIFGDKAGWYNATFKAEKKYGLPKHIQLAIIRQESGFDGSAKPSRNRFLFIFPGKRKSSARGFPQAVEGTWAQYQRATGNEGASRNNFKDAAFFVAWYGRESNKRLGIRMDDAYSQYLAYHEGWGGYQRGSYRSKAWLRETASKVSNNAARYARQLDRCEGRFRKGIPLVPFI